MGCTDQLRVRVHGWTLKLTQSYSSTVLYCSRPHMMHCAIVQLSGLAAEDRAVVSSSSVVPSCRVATLQPTLRVAIDVLRRCGHGHGSRAELWYHAGSRSGAQCPSRGGRKGPMAAQPPSVAATVGSRTSNLSCHKQKSAQTLTTTEMATPYSNDHACNSTRARELELWRRLSRWCRHSICGLLGCHFL